MVFVPDGLMDGSGRILFREDAPRRSAYDKNVLGYALGILGAVASAGAPVVYRAAPIAAAAVVAEACGSPSGPSPLPSPTPTPTPTPPPATKNTITDRIDGSLISGSQIFFEGIDGTGFGTRLGPFDVTNGEYSAPLQVGATYKVTITGAGHIEHKNLSYRVTAANGNNFTVVELGSGQNGVVYDSTFDGFFQSFARNEGNPDNWRGIQKWDTESNPPREVYISLTAPSQYYSNWNSEAAAEFKTLLNEIFSESLSGLFCGKVPSIQVSDGPSVGTYKSGALIAAIRPDATQINDIHKDGNGYVDGEILSLIAVTFNDPQKYRDPTTRKDMKGRLLHELTHFAGAFHAFDGPYQDSTMARDYARYTQLSAPDRFGLCLIGKPDTKPRNQKPDTNMSGVTATSASITAGTVVELENGAVGLNGAPMQSPVLNPNQMPRHEREQGGPLREDTRGKGRLPERGRERF